MYSESTKRSPSGAARRVFRRIDETARRLGLDGCGDALDPPALKTMGQVHFARCLFLAAKLGRLPDWLRDAAADRCHRIVATSSRFLGGGGDCVADDSPDPTSPQGDHSSFSESELDGLVDAIREGGVR